MNLSTLKINLQSDLARLENILEKEYNDKIKDLIKFKIFLQKQQLEDLKNKKPEIFL